MGYIRHHAIIVTGTYEDWIDRAHAKALELTEGPNAPPVTPIMDTPLGARSFAVLPDGSKEGWSTSTKGDEIRAEFVAWLQNQVYEDGSTPLAWVEVQYGDDDGETTVLNDSDGWKRRA